MEKTAADYTEKNIQAVINKCKSLLRSVERPGMDGLITWLEGTDFFTAPASTRFHGNFKHGLVLHSYAVYTQLDILTDAYYKEVAPPQQDSNIICALLHDACKANLYVEKTRNVKNEETGTWEKAPFYLTEDPLPYGHGEKSVYLISKHIVLEEAEAMAIRWHMGAFDDSVKGGSYALNGAYSKYPYAMLLHFADMAASNITGI